MDGWSEMITFIKNSCQSCGQVSFRRHQSDVKFGSLAISTLGERGKDR